MQRKHIYMITGGLVALILLGLIIGLVVNSSKSHSSSGDNNKPNEPNPKPTQKTEKPTEKPEPTQGPKNPDTKPTATEPTSTRKDDGTTTSLPTSTTDSDTTPTATEKTEPTSTRKDDGTTTSLPTSTTDSETTTKGPHEPTEPPKEPENENDKYLLKDSKKLLGWINNTDLQHTTSFYFYDVQNPAAIMKGEKPIVKEVGPYVFKEQRIYNVDGWEQDDEYLNLKYKKQYFPVNTEKLEEEITILNVPLISSYHLAEKLNAVFKGIFHRYAKGKDLFIKHKVGDLLFNGYRNSFIKRLEQIHYWLKIKAPNNIKNGKFSLMQARNDSTYGDYTVNTGKSNLDELGEIFKIDGNSFIGCWKDPCNIIKGTDGIIHHKSSSASEKIDIFVPELNRTVQLDRMSDKEKINGQITSSFKWSDNTFKSAKEYEKNKCFCPTTKDTFDEFSGIHRNSHCNFDIPMVFSLPHFYQADKYFLDEIEGFDPDGSKHRSNIYLTKDESILVKGHKKIQINMDTNIASKNRNIKRFIFPIFWLDEQTTNLKYSKK